MSVEYLLQDWFWNWSDMENRISFMEPSDKEASSCSGHMQDMQPALVIREMKGMMEHLIILAQMTVSFLSYLIITFTPRCEVYYSHPFNVWVLL